MDWIDPPSISQVAPNLFVGNLASSLNRNVLRYHNITAIVSLLDEPCAKWNYPRNREIVPQHRHLFVPCLDTSTMDILVLLDDICRFIDIQLDKAYQPSSPTTSTPSTPSDTSPIASPPTEQSHNAPNVLIHCRLGMSRSASVAIAYLMRQRQQSLDIVFPDVRARRKVRPRDNFLDQLRVWEAAIYHVWEDQDKLVPKEQYQEYLSRRDVRLKSKGLTGNEPISLICQKRGY